MSLDKPGPPSAHTCLHTGPSGGRGPPGLCLQHQWQQTGLCTEEPLTTLCWGWGVEGSSRFRLGN